MGLSVLNSCVPSVAVPQMLAMMVDLEEDEEWAMADELEDDDFDRYRGFLLRPRAMTVTDTPELELP